MSGSNLLAWLKVIGVLLVLIILGVAGFVLWGKIKAGLAWLQSKGGTDLVNPASDKNVVYQSTNTIGAKVTGNDNFTVGGAIYDFFHPRAGLANNESVDVHTGRIVNSGNVLTRWYQSVTNTPDNVEEGEDAKSVTNQFATSDGLTVGGTDDNLRASGSW